MSKRVYVVQTIKKDAKHKCSCCGQTGHRIEGCPLPGAKELLALRKAVKPTRSRFRLPTRVGPKKSGEYKKIAQADYGSAVVKRDEAG